MDTVSRKRARLKACCPSNAVSTQSRSCCKGATSNLSIPKETPGTVSFVDNNTTKKVEIMRSSNWIRPLTSSSAALASIGALVIAVPLTAPGTSIARSVTSPAYELLSHDTNEINENGNEVHTNGTHVDDVHTNGTHVEDVHTNGTHVDDVTATNGTHVEDVHINGTHVDAISDSSGGKFTGYVPESRTRNQTAAQPRVKKKSSSTKADPITSGSYAAGSAVPVAVTVSSAKPAKSAEKESSSSVKSASSESVSAQSNGASTRSKVRSTRTSAARS